MLIPTHRLISLTATLGLLVMASPSVVACNDQPYIGSVCATAANFCPRGYTAADGRTLSVAQNQALFALLGTTYGGNGTSTFSLPDLQGRSLVGTGHGPGGHTVELGQQRGQAEVTLTQAQMPQHSHRADYTAGDFAGKIAATTVAATQGDPTAQRRFGATGRNPIYSDSNGSLVEMPGVNISQQGAEVIVHEAGGSQPFNNLPPQLGVTYCIAVQGLFPTRD